MTHDAEIDLFVTILRRELLGEPESDERQLAHGMLRYLRERGNHPLVTESGRLHLCQPVDVDTAEIIETYESDIVSLLREGDA